MRFILNGGEAIVARTARRFLALLAPHGLPAGAMHPAWGMSETCSGVAYSERFSLATARDEDACVEVGRPLPGVWLRIVDAPGVVVEEGRAGSLEIKGPTVTRGYHRNPELNSEVFDDGWFRTGDLGFLADGRLTITGREKDVIIINGVNHYCHEIEAVAEEVQGVEVSFTAACAVRAPGDDTDRLAVFFSPAQGEASAELVERLRSALVTRGGINPSYLLPVLREEIPKTAIGKIQRAELRRRFEAGELEGVLRAVDLLTENANTLPDWFFRREWRRREPVGGGGAAPGGERTLVFADRRGLAAALLPLLGDSAVAVEEGGEGGDLQRLGAGRYALDPASPDHYRRLLAELAAEGALPARVLHLWAYDLSGAPVTGPGDLEEAQRLSVLSLLFLLQALAPYQAEAAGGLELWVVSGRAQPVQPGEAVAYGAATLPGFLKTVSLEMSGIRCCHVDLEGTSTGPEAQELWRELAGGDKIPEVAYRGGRRLAPRLVNAGLPRRPAEEMPVETGGTYLVTGGLGGIGTSLVRLLAERYRARVLMVGRTPLPPRAQWPERSQEATAEGGRLRSFMTLEALGGEVTYEAVDVGDLAALREAVGAAEAKWGRPLAGIFHLAGVGGLEGHWQVASEHRLEVETPVSFQDMFRPKVQGTWNLLRLLEGRPEALFVAFSSVTAVFGGATFAAYSAANSFLDACCFHHRGHGLPRVFCFDWSQWDEMGMSRGNPAAAREAAALLGFRLIGDGQGLRSMLAGLARGPANLIVGLDGTNRNIRREMAAGPLEVRGITAWVVPAGGGFEEADVAALAVADRYGRRSACAVQILDRLPRLESGEIDRSRLASRAARGPASLRRTSPRSEVERQIAEIWRDLLRVGDVGVEESFFALGGHSLLATQLVARLQKTFKVEVSLRSLFEEPTVAGLARRLLESETEPGQLEATARLRRRIAAMSAGEAQELLRRRAAQPGMAR
jgi:NAD(P)-dependent dehydrogenase (short-subunit alcohol dehydrogenase family)/acyl carrier protein